MPQSETWDRAFAGDVLADPAVTHGSRHRSHRQKSTKRRDIQGLRAVAVVAVVVNHVTGHPVGGFVGVDVFFVISGYLITQLLLRDLERTSGPARYISDFYRRRVRRLFPAALLTIALTTAAAYALLSAARAKQTLTDGAWAAVFGANWHFSAVGTNYFSAASPPSPLQHYWSLSVEEQFYMLWPIALFLVAATLGRRLGRRGAGAVAAAVLTVGCLAYGAVESSSSPTAAYFSTFTRGWELGIGALLACALPSLRMPRQVATVMSWAGLALIGVALFVTAGGPGFPVPAAVLPCLGSALVLAATAHPSNVVLTNPVSVFIGDISYSVYLVHYPVIILLAARIPTGAGYDVAAVLLTAALATAMYGLVERPVLRSRFLQPAAEKERAAAADDPVPTTHLAFAAAITLVAALGVYALSPTNGDVAAARQARISAALSRAVSPHTATPKPTPTRAHATHPSKPKHHAPPTMVPLGPKGEAVARDVRAALHAQSWPALSPSMNTVVSGPVSPPNIEQCGGDQLGPLSECLFGNPSASHTFYLVGDSTSMVWAEAFIHIVAGLPNWNVRVAGGYGCNFADQVLTSDGANQYAASCGSRQRAVVADIKKMRPDVLVVTNSTGRQAVTDSAGRELGKVARFVGHIVVLPSQPQGSDPHACYQPGASPAACAAREDIGDYSTWVFLERMMAAQYHGRLINPAPWFCAADFCAPFNEGVPTYYDSVHMTDAYSAHLAPALLESLKNAGVFRASS